MTVIAFPQRPINREHYFGGCPECGNSDGYLNIGGNHWFSCDAHRTRWCAGYNLFSDWRCEAPEIWDANEASLSDYRVVEPLPMAGLDRR